MDQIGDEVNESLILNEDLLTEKEEHLENFLTSYIFCNHPIENAGGCWKTNLNSVCQSILQFSHCSIKTSPNMKGYYCKECCVLQKIFLYNYREVQIQLFVMNVFEKMIIKIILLLLLLIQTQFSVVVVIVINIYLQCGVVVTDCM